MKRVLLRRSAFERELAQCGAPIPLLVLRLPQFERLAWREGKRAARRFEAQTTRAFLAAARNALRLGDAAAHEPGSDVYLAAMLAPSREARACSGVDCRAALRRLSDGIAESGADVQSGWTILRNFDGQLQRAIGVALEQGAREQERYDFFAAVGHELRTPLTSIRGYLETVIDGGVDVHTSRRFLETARTEALRMSRLLEGMFEFSLLDRTAEHFARCSCELAAQVELACEIAHPAARAKGIALRTGELTQLRVGLDADACLQMLVNLLENAVKYGRDGGCVRVSYEIRDGDAAIRVDDDGPGIPPAERDAIFALRARGSRSSGRPGTGIGLAIVKAIAERAGGCASAAESPLGGARFEVTLPLRAESAQPAS